MQHRLGLSTDCGALDINQGCSGFVYGLSIAKALIESNIATNVLLITAETYSKFIHPQDRSVRTIFSDGASATLIAAVESGEDCIGPFVLGTDGRGAQELIVPAGGHRMPLSPGTAVEKDDGSGNIRSDQNLFMNGAEIFNFTIRTVPAVVSQLLQKAGMELEEVDFFVFHQANKFMLDHLRKKLRIPPEKFCINMESYGNTVSSTIPMALEIARAQGQVRTGDKVMLVGFGVGYSWAATMLNLL
jgi:3-oxoacyl-[acyl-carrier-protein] synthase-3